MSGELFRFALNRFAEERQMSFKYGNGKNTLRIKNGLRKNIINVLNTILLTLELMSSKKTEINTTPISENKRSGVRIHFIYVGAADGRTAVLVARLFPWIQFSLFDDGFFDMDLMDENIMGALQIADNVAIMSNLYEQNVSHTETTTVFNTENGNLIIDRSNTFVVVHDDVRCDGKLSNHNRELVIQADIQRAVTLSRKIKADLSRFKYKPLFLEDLEYDSIKYMYTVMPSGIIVPQSWNSCHSAEVSWYSTLEDLKTNTQVDNLLLAGRINYFNLVNKNKYQSVKEYHREIRNTWCYLNEQYVLESLKIYVPTYNIEHLKEALVCFLPVRPPDFDKVPEDDTDGKYQTDSVSSLKFSNCIIMLHVCSVDIHPRITNKHVFEAMVKSKDYINLLKDFKKFVQNS